MKNETDVGNSSTFNYYSFTMTVPEYSCYYFAYKARNSFGVSSLSKEFLFVAAYPPKAINQLVISNVGQNVSISWSNSFEKNGYEFIYFDIIFEYHMPTPIGVAYSQSLQRFCNLMDLNVVA